ncbi:MAG: family 43 glycosylhydrolase [Clostridia bacterium]
MIMNRNLFPGEGYADPHAVVHEGRVYLFCGRDYSAKIEDFCRMHKWSIVSSDDLVNWRHESDIYPTETYIGDQKNCWATHIVKRDDTFYFYFSNKNINTGVMVSKNVTGPFEDALGKPLIPERMMPTSSYDPCVYHENGKYTIFFGAGTYYCAELGDDMLSLAETPQKVEIFDNDGNFVPMGDKSTVFKHGKFYYLVCGDRYSMSENLKGPYKFVGEFVEGGHNDYFEFNGKSYISFEHHDTNIYFRGIAVTEIFFNEDGTVVPQDEVVVEFHKSRTWEFSKSAQYWFRTDGKDAELDNSAISYELNPYIGIRGPVFPNFRMFENHKLTIELESGIENASLKILIDTVAQLKAYAKDPNIFTKSNIIELLADKNIYSIELEIDQPRVLRCIRIFGAGEEDQGNIRIKSISFSKV